MQIITPRTPISKVYFEDNLHRMKQYDDNQFSIGIIDPPYAINATKMPMGTNLHRKGFLQYPGESTATKLRKKQTNRLTQGGGKLKNRILNTSKIDWDNEIPSPEFFKEFFRITKNQIIFGANYYDLPPTRCMICWDKMQPWDNFSQFELAWTSFDYPAKLYRISNTGGANQEPKIHPTQKPVKLYRQILKDFTKPGDTIIDTHLGSGSHRIAAYEMQLDFVAFENNEIHYFDQEKRFSNFISKYGVIDANMQFSQNTQLLMF